MSHSQVTESQVRTVMSRIGTYGGNITQIEFTDLLKRANLEEQALLLFPVEPMEMIVYGIHLHVLRMAAHSSHKSTAAYAEEILRDAQDAFGRDLITAGHQLINQARWLLSNVVADEQDEIAASLQSALDGGVQS